MLERDYQALLSKELRQRFPGAVIMKNDTYHVQGFPDLTMLHGPNWATLEVKAHRNAPEQPNQRYYVDMLNEMSFAAFIDPDNETEVLDALQHTFESLRNPRVS